MTDMKINKLSAELAEITNNGQIKGIIANNEDGTPLTQADYDALPATKETDNCLYLIRG
jgi:hypothetical protein